MPQWTGSPLTIAVLPKTLRSPLFLHRRTPTRTSPRTISTPWTWTPPRKWRCARPLTPLSRAHCHRFNRPLHHHHLRPRRSQPRQRFQFRARRPNFHCRQCKNGAVRHAPIPTNRVRFSALHTFKGCKIECCAPGNAVCAMCQTARQTTP